MEIRFTCPSGHRLRASAAMEGKKCVCPKCHKVAVVPVQAKNRISDTGVMQILGDADLAPLPDFQPHAPVVYKTCPKCKRQLPEAAAVCDQCQLYLDVTSQVWDRFLKTTPGENRPR